MIATFIQTEILQALAEASWQDYFFGFAFYYPLLMAWMWIVGGIWYYLRWERKHRGPEHIPDSIKRPPATILIPCFNEEANLHEVIYYALASEHPEFEVIAINDGSKDATAQILNELALQHPRLRVIHLASNQGKAIALRAGAIAAKHEFLVCIDGDALLHPHALSFMVGHMASEDRVGAVTGNPRILNRSSLLGKLQVGEFSSTIGLMKRAQRVYGRIFTVSGVISGYRRAALNRIGYWDESMITEDIDISWRLQMDHWNIRYEPNALCYIRMPETFKGLWKQRLRWAQGGMEVMLKHDLSLFKWRRRRFWMVALEHLFSLVWSYVMFTIIVLFLLGLIFPIPEAWRVETLLPTWSGVMLGVTATVQFALSLVIDRRYEPRKRFLRNYFWVIWYPLAFWLISLFTTVVALPKTLLKKRGTRARWTSPDRGYRHQAKPQKVQP
jgi:biofilm PGA synthesis N-glycosyltransferase PgaC